MVAQVDCIFKKSAMEDVGKITIFGSHSQHTHKHIVLLHFEGDRLLKQVAQRGCRCPGPGNIQGQVEQSSREPYLVVDVPAHCRWVGLEDL